VPHLTSEGSVGEVRALTGLRGAAALLVASYHYYPIEQFQLGALSAFIGRGYLWVDTFFILSGYVLTLKYNRQFAAANKTPHVLRDFLVARFARIYPLYAAGNCSGQ
jgi:peptidoglycan/LPS O-acetylase OafA/YrhL